jgi:hypothetical protein
MKKIAIYKSSSSKASFRIEAKFGGGGFESL